MARFLPLLLIILGLPGRALPAPSSSALEQAVLVLVNQARVKRHLTAYRSDPVLAEAARVHCQNMARFNFFDHDSPVAGQREVNDRVIAAGGGDGDFGENLYWCRGMLESRVAGSVLAEWLSSTDHRDTVLSQEYSKVGVGAFHRGKEFWVTLVCQ